MKKEKALSDYFMKNNLTFYLYYLLKTIHRIFIYYFIPDKIAIQLKFRKRMGYKLDLKNPVDFNEKLQWLKLYDRKKEYTECADKFKVRNYIKKVLGEDAEKYFVPLVFHTKNVKDLNPENMPNYPVIIKTNHDQGGFKIIWDKNKVDWKQIQMFFRKRLKFNHYWNNREWPYKNVERRIIVEKLLINNNDLPIDIKLHCFNGNVRIIQVSKYETDSIKKFAFYDMQLNRIINGVVDTEGIPQIEKFKLDNININEMISISKKLSTRMKYVRIDFLRLKDHIFIGEMTFYPTAGFIKYFSPKLLKEIGSWLNLSNDIVFN